MTLPDGSVHSYEYDYRTRRVGTATEAAGTTKQTAIVFSGGLSVAEWETTTGSLPVSPTVEYTRGPDMGGGVGGLLYSLRDESGSTTAKYNLSNGRGDIVAQASQSAALTWTASYEAYGKRTKETGTNQDKQRGNSKDEDPTGLLNEHFRYRDIETSVWLSRDPAGFVDGPNLYAYVNQNPWSTWDPYGLMVPRDAREARSVAKALNRQSKQLQKDIKERDQFAYIVKDGKGRMENSWVYKRAQNKLEDLNYEIEKTSKSIAYHAESLAIYCSCVESGKMDAIGHKNFMEKRTGDYNGGGLEDDTGNLLNLYAAGSLLKSAASVLTRFTAAEKTLAQKLADKLRSLPANQRPNTVAVIKHEGGGLTIGRNQGGVTDPQVEAAIKASGTNVFAGECAEVNAMARAMQKGRILEGAEISVANVRGPSSRSGVHGTPKTPCNVCQPVMDNFGVSLRE